MLGSCQVHPQIKLIELEFPSFFERFHPSTILRGVGNIHEEPDEVVAIEHAGMPPVAFYGLRLIAGGAELPNDFEHRVSQPLGGDVAGVVELERQEYLESPPPAGHSWP